MIGATLVEIDDRAAAVIAAGMRKVAEADGDIHPNELALINDFAEGITSEAESASWVIRTDELRAAYLHSLVFTAMADGRVSPEERVVILGLASEVGMDEAAVEDEILEVKRTFLAQFSDLTVFRDTVATVASELGLSLDAEPLS